MEEPTPIRGRFLQLRQVEHDLAAKRLSHESSVLESFNIPAARSETPAANVHTDIIKEWVTEVSHLLSLEPCISEHAAGIFQNLHAHTAKVLKNAVLLLDSRSQFPMVAETAGEECAELRLKLQDKMDAGITHLEACQIALDSIHKHDVYELKANMKPCDIIKYAFDGLLILMQRPLIPVSQQSACINKVEADFISSSYDEIARRWLQDMMFLGDVSVFVHDQRHTLNAETFELLEPYLRHDPDANRNWSPWLDHCVLEATLARRASGCGGGLCKVIHSLALYYESLKPFHSELDSLRLSLKRTEDMVRCKVSSIEKQEACLAQALRDGHELLQNVQASEKLDDVARENVAGLARALAMPFTLASLQERERIAYLATFPSTVQLDVITMDGETVRVEVDPRGTCNAIKLQILNERYIPTAYQRLFLESSELLDTETIADYPDMGHLRNPRCPSIVVTLVLCGDPVAVRQAVELKKREVLEEAEKAEANREKEREKEEAEAKDVEVKKQVNEVFERFDVNGDGRISSDEFASLLRELDPGTWNNAKIRRLMTAMDADRDQHIDFKEFVYFCFGSRYRTDIQRKQFLDTLEFKPTKDMRRLFG